MTGAQHKLTHGIDSTQRQLRRHLGLIIPKSRPKITAPKVGSILTEECALCGCTNAWPINSKTSSVGKVSCDYCGAPRRKIITNPDSMKKRF